jgi:class 3 adenylate cyclase/tetratricopeptide (TPR) repeat protein
VPPDAAERRLAAILYGDVVGYSRLMAQDEAATVGALKASQREMEQVVAEHEGRLVDAAGDSVLAEFRTATGALAAALGIQRLAAARNAALEAGRRMELRIAVHAGELRVEEGRLYGDPVNIAARIQTLAEPGGVTLSSAVFEQVRHKLPLGYEDLGDQELRNIPYPVRVYRLGVPAPQRAPAVERPASVAAQPVRAPTRGRPRRASIAVLPFEAFTPDASGIAHGDILATEIIHALSRPHGLRVASRLATSGYRGRGVDPRVIGHELAVDYVLGGSLRRRQDRMKVMVEIHDAHTGSQLWTRDWDLALGELRDTPEPIAEAIVGVFEGEFVRAEVQKARDVPADDLDARGLVHKARGWFLGGYTKDALVEARALSRRAVELQPNYGVAHATLALMSIELELNGWGAPRERNGLEARAAAERALELQPDHPICLENCGLTFGHLGEIERAERALRRAIAIAPTDVIARGHLGFVLGFGSAEEGAARDADALLTRVRETNPEHPLAGFWPFFHSSALLRLGRIPQTIDSCQEGVEALPGFVFTHLALANALALGGQLDPARAALTRAAEVNKRMTPADYSTLVERQSQGIAAAQINLEGLRKLGVL